MESFPARALHLLIGVTLLVGGCGSDGGTYSSAPGGSGTGGAGSGGAATTGGDEGSSTSSTFDISGEWEAHWGGAPCVALTLVQTTHDVVGTFDPGSGHDGSITGALTDRTLQGTWSYLYSAGELTFTFSDVGDTFTGTSDSTPDGRNDGTHAWSGHRVDGDTVTCNCQRLLEPCTTDADCCSLRL